jgi:hypothetical protein
MFWIHVFNNANPQLTALVANLDTKWVSTRDVNSIWHHAFTQPSMCPSTVIASASCRVFASHQGSLRQQETPVGRKKSVLQVKVEELYQHPSPSS